MRDVKRVNIVFMICTLMPTLVSLVLHLFHIEFKDSMQMIIVSQMVYAGPVLIYLLACGKSVKESLRINKIRVGNVFLLILFTYLIMPVISLVNAISLLFSENLISDTVSSITDEYSIGIAVLVVGVLPAILEESVYRGVFYNEYRKLNPRAAIVLSGLLFGLLHMNLNQFSYAFVLGVIFAVMIEATDSILSTMIMHFVINSSSVLTSYYIPKLMKSLGVSDSVAQLEPDLDKVLLIQTISVWFIPAVIGGVLAFIVFRTIAKNEGRYETVKQIFTHGERRISFFQFITIPLAIGIGVCLFNIIGNLMA